MLSFKCSAMLPLRISLSAGVLHTCRIVFHPCSFLGPGLVSSVLVDSADMWDVFLRLSWHMQNWTACSLFLLCSVWSSKIVVCCIFLVYDRIIWEDDFFFFVTSLKEHFGFIFWLVCQQIFSGYFISSGTLVCRNPL